MNDTVFREMLPLFDEIWILNKKLVMADRVIQLVGATLYRGKVKIHLLQYDPAQDSTGQSFTIADTYRQSIHRRQLEHKQNNNRFSFDELRLQEQIFPIGSCHSSMLHCEYGTWENHLLLYEYVKRGFVLAEEISEIPFEHLMWWEGTLQGEYSVIPFTKESEPFVLVSTANFLEFPVWKQMVLQVGKDYPQPFYADIGEEKIPFYIHRVFVESYQLPDFEIEQIDLKEGINPKQKMVLMVEYELEKGNFQFYRSDYLDKKIRPCSSSELVSQAIAGSAQAKGRHGMRLLTAVVDEFEPEKMPSSTSDEDSAEISIEITDYFCEGSERRLFLE